MRQFAKDLRKSAKVLRREALIAKKEKQVISERLPERISKSRVDHLPNIKSNHLGTEHF